MIYGDLPEDLGRIDLPTDEMMFWMYCPVSTPGEGWTIPDNLKQFTLLLERVWWHDEQRAVESYIYLTAKTLWATPSNPGNRPGWHSDGFGTDDVNFIWYDRAPTEFYSDSFELPENCADAIAIMTERAEGAALVTYPERHLLRLTPSCIHRVAAEFDPGMRTFLKISVSKDRYNLVGNARNHGLRETHWPLLPRLGERNHPCRDSFPQHQPEGGAS